MPRGNFYFYFRDKRSIFEAVVERRIAALDALCASFEAEHDEARERLCAFVDHLVARRDEVARFGCPVGTLTGEVGKWRDDHIAIARRLFDVLRPFLRSQFRALGADSKTADTLAVELLARTQGINTLADANLGVSTLIGADASVVAYGGTMSLCVDNPRSGRC